MFWVGGTYSGNVSFERLWYFGVVFETRMHAIIVFINILKIPYLCVDLTPRGGFPPNTTCFGALEHNQANLVLGPKSRLGHR